MMPPTGLTFIIHGSVVLVKKIGSYFGFFRTSRAHKKNGMFGSALSLLIIFVIVAYISWVAFIFAQRAVADDKASWRTVHREAEKLASVLWNTPVMANRRALPICNESILVISSPPHGLSEFKLAMSSQAIPILSASPQVEPIYNEHLASIINNYSKSF